MNDPPTAINDVYTTSEDTGLSIAVTNVLLNDTDADGNPLTAVQASGPSNGILTLNPNGSFNYTPSLNFNGSDSFTYRAYDGVGYSDAATVTITITPLNDTPTANPQPVTISEDTVTAITLTGSPGPANESSQTLSYFLDITPSNGALYGSAVDAAAGTNALLAVGSPLGSATVYYKTSLNNDTSTSFNFHVQDNGGGSTYTSEIATVSITVGSVNDAPTDLALSSSSISENSGVGAVVGTLSSTDQDTGDSHSYTLVEPGSYPDNASFTILGNQLKTAADFNFETKSSYSIKVQTDDGHGGTFDKVLTITVTNANDAPVILSPVLVETSEDTSVMLTGSSLIVVSDFESDAVTLTLTVDHGTLSTGGVTSSTLWLAGSPAQVNNVLSGLKYTPEANYNGSDSINVVVWESMTPVPLGATSVSNVNVTPVNDAPVVTPFSIVTLEDTPMNLIGENAIVVTDLEGDSVSVTLAASHGTLMIGDLNVADVPLTGSLEEVNATLSGLTYIPDHYYNGNDTISVTVNETSTPEWLHTSSSIGVTIRSVDNPPVLNAPLSVTTDEDTSISLNGINGIAVSDVEDDIVRVTLRADHGTLTGGQLNGSTITLTGTPSELAVALSGLTYTPTANYNETDTISVTVNETSTVDHHSATANIDVNITPVNDPPRILVMDDPPTSATAGTTVDLKTVFRVEDVDGDNLTFQLAAMSNGQPVDTLNINSGGGSAGITRDAAHPNGIISVSGSPEAINMALSTLTETLPSTFSGNLYFSSSVHDGIAPVVSAATSPGLTVNPVPVVVDNTQVTHNYVAPTIVPPTQSVTTSLVDAPLSSSGTVTNVSFGGAETSGGLSTATTANVDIGHTTMTETNTSVQILTIEVKTLQSTPEPTASQPAAVAAADNAAQQTDQAKVDQQKQGEQAKAVEQQKVVDQQQQAEQQQAAEKQVVAEQQQAEQSKPDSAAEATNKAVEKVVEKTGSEHAATLVGVQVAVVSTGGHTMIVVYNPATVAAASGGLVGTTTQVDLGTAQTMSVGSFTQYLAEAAKAAAASAQGASAFELPPGITISDVKRSCNECTQNLSK